MDVIFYISNGTDYKLSLVNGFEAMCASTAEAPLCQNTILDGSSGTYTGTFSTPNAEAWVITP